MRSEPYLTHPFREDPDSGTAPADGNFVRVHPTSTSARRTEQPLPRIPLPGEMFANATANELSGILDQEDQDGEPLSLSEISEEYDIRYITPRKMIDLSFDLYFSGFLSKEQYAELAFQSELMPNFDQTIGALTGQKAEPDRPRDFTKIWLQRLEFEKQHADDPRIVQRTEKILDLLKSIDRKKKTKPATSGDGQPTVKEDSKEVATAVLPPLSLNRE